MTSCGFYVDDALVCDERVRKFHSPNPRVEIRLRHLASAPV
jgi:Holliday junction resolvase RusA-like endonuclease